MKEKREKLSKLENEKLGNCQRCNLCKERNSIVFGEGDSNADIMLIGEAPGRVEDKTGRPFVGRSGKFLTKLLEKANLDRKDIYITNIVKCRPPNNRNPKQEEIDSCSNFLRGQIHFIEPKAIISAGKFASNTVAGKDGKPLYKLLENENLEYSEEEVKVVPIYHPAYILRQKEGKKRKLSISTVEKIERTKEFASN